MNGWELGELHDVDTTESKTTPVDADAVLLQDSADSSIWKRLTWANLKATLLTYFNGEYVAKNTAITGATKTKITYDAKGLVTAGADATTADIADSTNKRYVTDAQQTVIGNTSGTNTGDQNLFSTIAVSGQSNVVADTTGDTLTLVAGSNVTITTNPTTDSITIAASGGGGGDVTTLYNSNAQTGPSNTTTETAIFSYALPTDLAAGDTLVLSLAGVYKNGSGVSETPTIRVKLGATTMLSGSPAAIATNNTERVGGFELRLFVEATNAQRCFVVGTGVQQPIGTMAATNNATMYAVNGHGTATEDLTSAKTLQITCQFTAANANLYMYSESVTLYKVSAA
jgi:hypothetical protein